MSASIKRCLILDLKIGVSFVYATLSAYGILHPGARSPLLSSPLPVGPSLSFLPRGSPPVPPSSAGCPARPGGMSTPFDQAVIIGDSGARLSEGPGCGDGGEKGGRARGLGVQEASPQRTEKSPGIPPALMRSIPGRRGPQAASGGWNARPPSLTALLRAAGNSLSE